ncbi:uncharacterized protein [Dysidea avara]|uniref:uncharacterized protein isoform X2 n=1 Tax=Dysidea avara TaxID=196820 RepID=UPI00331DBA0C
MFFLNVGNSFCYPIYIILLIHRHGKVFRRPKCNEEVGGLSNQKNYAFPDASCTNDMKYLETGCSTKPKPCDWRGKLLQLEIHLAECGNVVIQCTLNCGATISYRSISRLIVY